MFKVPFYLVNLFSEFAKDFAKQIKSNMRKPLAENPNVGRWLILCAKFDLVSPKDIAAEWAESKAVLTNMVAQDTDRAFTNKIYALLKMYTSLRFKQSHPNFGALVEVCLGGNSQNFSTLGTILWTGDNNDSICRNLVLMADSCKLLENCFDEIKSPYIVLKMSMFMEAMMWVVTYHSISSGSFVRTNVLRLWEKVPSLLIKLSNSEKDNREMTELLNGRGKDFAEVLRNIMAGGHIKVDAESVSLLNQLFKGVTFK